jgi:uncharacterized repeat protein (TIGR03803 family)
MSRFERLIAALILPVVLSVVLPAQTFTTLVTLNDGIGSDPEGSLFQGVDGDLYGVVSEASGALYKVSPGGTFTDVFGFCCAAGFRPWGVMQTRDGSFWGTTQEGGPHGLGNVYQISPELVATDIADLTGHAGENPNSGLILATDGNFYGTANLGGNINGCDGSCGTIFKVTPSGRLTQFYGFCPVGACPDGANPIGPVVQASDGNLYGTAFSGGGAGCLLGLGCGTVFQITLGGVFTTLHEFAGTDGGNPWDVGLIQASDGNLYGTTSTGGANGVGTVFRVSSSGAFATIYNFCGQTNCTDGAGPLGGVIQATDGNLYGATTGGGAYSEGTVFRLTLGGKLTTLHSFCAPGCPDGENPSNSLFQATDGRIYGTTENSLNYGGGVGTVFRMDLGLASSVSPLPAFGSAGQAITILGYNLESTSSVSFNGVAAPFTVETATRLNAVVPIGASTGPIVVTIAGSTLRSKNFNVLP